MLLAGAALRTMGAHRCRRKFGHQEGFHLLAQPWNPPEVSPSAVHLQEQRIVSAAMTNPSHIAFNQLRTKIYKTLHDNGWKSLAITSPTANCGKTMVSINLAYSLARQPSFRTVLIDLDLKKSTVASALGVSAPGSIGSYLSGGCRFEDCFVEFGENLIVGLNGDIVKNSAEMMHDQRTADMLANVARSFRARHCDFRSATASGERRCHGFFATGRH